MEDTCYLPRDVNIYMAVSSHRFLNIRFDVKAMTDICYMLYVNSMC